MTRVEYACQHSAVVPTLPQGVKATRIVAGCRPCPACQAESDAWQAAHPVKVYREDAGYYERTKLQNNGIGHHR